MYNLNLIEKNKEFINWSYGKDNFDVLSTLEESFIFDHTEIKTLLETCSMETVQVALEQGDQITADFIISEKDEIISHLTYEKNQILSFLTNIIKQIPSQLYYSPSYTPYVSPTSPKKHLVYFDPTQISIMFEEYQNTPKQNSFKLILQSYRHSIENIFTNTMN